MTAERAVGGGRAAVLAVGGTLLVLVLVTWAASIGPGQVLEGEGPDRVRPIATATGAVSEEASADTDEGEPPPASGDSTLISSIVTVVVMALVAGAALAGIAWGLLWVWRRRPRPRARPEEVDFEVLDAPPARVVAEAVVADASAQRAVLLEGSPRNGIVACWHRFEVQAARAGVRREPWETSSEYALRILALAEADTHAVHALAERFREARFSEHEVTEADRARAVDLLDQIHASLGGTVAR